MADRDRGIAVKTQACIEKCYRPKFRLHGWSSEVAVRNRHCHQVVRNGGSDTNVFDISLGQVSSDRGEPQIRSMLTDYSHVVAPPALG